MKNSAIKKFALDTNVLIYASDESNRFYQPSGAILELADKGKIKICLADKNLFEFYAVLSNTLYKSNPEGALEAFDFYLNHPQLESMHTTKLTSSLVSGLLKIKNTKGKYTHDLVLAAICLENDIDYLITYNLKDFEGIQGLTAISPEEIGSIIS